MKRDSLGLFFRIEKKLGRGDLFEIISHFASGEKKLKIYQHEFNDGLGALLLESKEWHISKFKLPSFQLKTPFKISIIYDGLKGFKEDLTPSQTYWKSFDCRAPYTNRHLAWRVFSPESTAALRDFARTRCISINSLMLASTNSVITDQLMSSEQTDCRWLIPVNMRRTQSERECPQNHTSSVGLRFNRGASLTEIDQLYRKAINKWRALAAESLASLAGMLGEKFLFQLAKQRGKRNSWIGSFTNLGVWSFPDAQQNNNLPEAISVAPPAGTPCFPVGVGIVTWQNHLTLSLRLHPSLVSNRFELPEEVVNAICVQLSEMLKTELNLKWSSKNFKELQPDHMN